MIYLYDRAICDDLIQSFNPDNVVNPVVTVVSKDQSIGVAAQQQDDKITFPMICVVRDDDTSIDNSRMNFSRAHRGVASVLDAETNELYYEKAVPIKLSYKLCIYTTNQADLDELIRELTFKYIDMYFLHIQLPYEADRRVRFGVSIDPDAEISKASGSSDYLEGGTLYEADIQLRCDGAVMVTYTPAKLRRLESQIDVN